MNNDGANGIAVIVHSGLSDQGHFRFRNEDFIIHAIPEDEQVLGRKGFLFAVCDGVGGSGSGDVASREAAQALVENYYTGKDAPAVALRKAVERANLSVYDLQAGNAAGAMQTTLSAIVLCGASIHVAHVGDSRIYRLRREPGGDGTPGGGNWDVSQLTTDHSEVAEMVKMQLVSPDMMRRHPRRNIITRSLGNQPIVRPQYLTESLLSGDIFVLCTDGLWEPVVEQTMAEIVIEYDLDEACRKLVALAIALGATDNVSVQIVKVIEAPVGAAPRAGQSSLIEYMRRILGGK